MDKKVPREIEDCLQSDESILWWGKPDLKIKSIDEKIAGYGFLLVAAIIIAFFILTFGIKQFAVFYGFCLMTLFPVGIVYVYIYIKWRLIKKSMFFTITDKRVFMQYNVNKNKKFIQKPLSEIHHFEVRKNKKGGNLYLGKYRFNMICFRFDYEKGYRDWFNSDEIFYRHPKILFMHQYDPVKYFCFFDLADVDTPAQIIRERTSAKEYIDPKRKKI